MDQITGVAPSGSMGCGYDLASFKRAMAAQPDFIGQDAGSTDMGPYYHGADQPFLPLSAYRRDLAVMLAAARSARIPLMIGSAITNAHIWHWAVSPPISGSPCPHSLYF